MKPQSPVSIEGDRFHVEEERSVRNGLTLWRCKGNTEALGCFIQVTWLLLWAQVGLGKW